MSRIDQVWCNPSAVAMRLCAGMAGAKFALLSGRSATGRTMEGKCLFGTEFFFHNSKDYGPDRFTRMVSLDRFQGIGKGSKGRAV